MLITENGDSESTHNAKRGAGFHHPHDDVDDADHWSAISIIMIMMVMIMMMMMTMRRYSECTQNSKGEDDSSCTSAQLKVTILNNIVIFIIIISIIIIIIIVQVTILTFLIIIVIVIALLIFLWCIISLLFWVFCWTVWMRRWSSSINVQIICCSKFWNSSVWRTVTNLL